MPLAKLGDQMPIHVTRDTVNNVRGEVWINIYLAYLIQILFTINVIGWGVVGAYSLGRMVV